MEMDRQWMGDAMLGKILEGADLVFWTWQVGAGCSFAAGRESSPGAQFAHFFVFKRSCFVIHHHESCSSKMFFEHSALD